MSQGVIRSSARLFCGHLYPQSTFQQVILSRQGHRQSKSFTLMSIVKQRGPLSTTMRAERRNHTSCVAMKRETRVHKYCFQETRNHRGNQLPLCCSIIRGLNFSGRRGQARQSSRRQAQRHHVRHMNGNDTLRNHHAPP